MQIIKVVMQIKKVVMQGSDPVMLLSSHLPPFRPSIVPFIFVPLCVSLWLKLGVGFWADSRCDK